MSKRVVLLSGGLDSTVALAKQLEDGYECRPLYVDYRARHQFREMGAAQEVVWHYGLKLHVVNVWAGFWYGASSLTGGAGLMEGTSTVVPGRNLVLCSLASAYAMTVDATDVVIGCNRDDAAIYPDCRPEFIGGLSVFLKANGQPGVLAPLLEMTKAQVVQLGRRLKVPLELTWSCYAGGDKPCGECGACRLRVAAEASGTCPDCLPQEPPP